MWFMPSYAEEHRTTPDHAKCDLGTSPPQAPVPHEVINMLFPFVMTRRSQ